MRLPPMLLAAAAALTGVLSAGPAAAQSAYEINRLNQVIQVCNSPAGAAMPECAKLRGQLGMAPATPTGGAAMGLAGLLGQTLGAGPASAPPSSATDTKALQQKIAACVRDAAGDGAAVQACLAGADQPSGRSPFAAGSPFAQRPASADTATTIHRAGQDYHACVAADQANWRRCLPLLNGGRSAP